MPEQFLDNLDISAACPQKRCAGVAERMPPYFLRDAKKARHHADSIPHERLAPIRLSPLAVGAGKDPVACGLIPRVSSPSAERSREKRIEWNRLLRRLGFA